MTTIFETLVAQVEQSFMAFTGDTSVLFQRGKLALAEHRQQRRIVLVRPGGKVTPATRAGSQDLGDGRRIRMVMRREERVLAHLYAESETAAEQMLDNLIASCELTFGTGFRPVEYDWKTENTEASHQKYTETIVLTMAWHKPVLDSPEPLTQVEIEGHQCSFGAGDFNPADFSAADFLTAGGEAA